MPRPDRRRSGPDTTPDRPNAESPSSITDTAMVTDAGDSGTGPAVPRQRIPAEPVQLADVIGSLLEYSDLLDGQLAERLAAYREGYQDGREAGYAAGRQDQAAELDEAWNRIARQASRARPFTELERKRWDLRGEPRTREDFGKPHPGDYQGRKGSA